MIKKGDFVEIEFVAKVKDTGKIFDLTDPELAKKEGIFNPKAKYEPLIACVGYGELLKGLDEALEGKDVGIKYEIEIGPDKAFGKKLPELLKMIPLSRFKKEKMKPFPGMEINVDGMLGIIKTVGAGRVIVDFNHPLSGKEVVYDIKINKKISDDLEKLKAFLKMHMRLENVKIELKNNKAKIEFDIPKEIGDKISEEIKKRIPTIKEISFEKGSKK